jgi:hypothetical protein
MQDAKLTLPPITLVCPVPAWARVKIAPPGTADAGFAAGAALGALDALVRDNLQVATARSIFDRRFESVEHPFSSIKQ